MKKTIKKPITQENYSEKKIVSSKIPTTKTNQSKEFEQAVNVIPDIRKVIKLSY